MWSWDPWFLRGVFLPGSLSLCAVWVFVRVCSFSFYGLSCPFFFFFCSTMDNDHDGNDWIRVLVLHCCAYLTHLSYCRCYSVVTVFAVSWCLVFDLSFVVCYCYTSIHRDTLIQAVDTCLSSKVVSQNCETISPMAVDAVLGIIDAANATNVDLRDIKASFFSRHQPDDGQGQFFTSVLHVVKITIFFVFPHRIERTDGLIKSCVNSHRTRVPDRWDFLPTCGFSAKFCKEQSTSLLAPSNAESAWVLSMRRARRRVHGI